MYNDTSFHSVVIKRLHDETWQDVKLIAQAWTAEEARNNTVVTGPCHLSTEQTKRVLLISSTLWLDNPKAVIDKWENHTASTLWFINHMNIHTISFGQEPFHMLLGRLWEKHTNLSGSAVKYSFSFKAYFLLLKVKFSNTQRTINTVNVGKWQMVLQEVLHFSFFIQPHLEKY